MYTKGVYNKISAWTNCLFNLNTDILKQLLNLELCVPILQLAVCRGEDELEGGRDGMEQMDGQTIKQEILQQLELSSLEFGKVK